VTVGGPYAADFTITTQPSTSIPAGGSTSFQVTFGPAGEGLRTAVLSIANNDSNEAPYNFTVLGTRDVDNPAVEFTNAMAAAGLIGPDAEPVATPKQDGTANLIKYAFNMNLGAPDCRTLTPGSGIAGLPVITVPSPGTMRIEYLRRVGSGLIYVPRKSTTLVPTFWTPLTAPPLIVPIDANWERVHHDESFEPSTTPRIFGSVEVILP
jgi:hypothetical protein